MNIIEQYTKWLIRHPFKKTKTIVNDIVIRRNEPCSCGCGQKAKKCILKLYNERRSLTQLAKKELEKERKSIIKRVKKEYKGLTNGS